LIEIKDIKLGVRLLALNPMTLTAAIILLYLVALFLTRKISHHWEESSKDSNAERIQTRRKTWRSPAGHAQQEDGPRKRSLRCCDFQLGSIATRFSVGSHERFVDTARLADKGRSGGTPLRPQQTGTRSSDRSNSNGQTR
jgi:hypothetical protein